MVQGKKLLKTATVFIYALIFISQLSFPANASSKSIYLTDDEKSYLKSLDEIRMCIDPLWPPYEWLDPSGHYVGIGADVIALLSSRLGVPFVLVPTQNWQESVQYAKAGSCDILPLLNKTTERDIYLNFTSPYLISPSVMVVREDSDINSIRDLREKTVSIPDEFNTETLLKEKYPWIKLRIVKTPKEGIKLLANGEVDAVISDLLVASLLVQQEKLDNLKIMGNLDFENAFRIGVAKGKTKLLTILQKAVLSLSQDEKDAIFQRWNPLIIVSNNDTKILRVLLITTPILFFLILWGLYHKSVNQRLKNLNKELMEAKKTLEEANKKLEVTSRTDRLTGLANRYGIEEFLKRQIYRSKRGFSFAIAIGDIDHFKYVNDDYGHSQGDKVLEQIAHILKSSIREIDLVGRWGGEEFLVIYEDIEEKDLFPVTDRIRKQVESHDFGLGRTITISLGVALFEKDEGLDSLIYRADEALYEAKRTGRNKVVTAKTKLQK